LWIFLRLRTFLKLFFKFQGPTCEIRDCGFIFEKPRGFFAKLPGIIDFGIILPKKTRGQRPTSVHGGSRQCGRERIGMPAGACRTGATTRRRLPRGAEEGEGDVAVLGVPSPEMGRQ
jgi:hypothetical protein